MRSKATCAIVLLAIVTCLYACSRRESGGVRQSTVGRISGADGGRITYHSPTGAVTMPLTAEEAKKLVEAISTARKDDPLKACAAEFHIGLWRGTNVLGELSASHEHKDGFGFGMDGNVYLDTTGTLRNLAGKFRVVATETIH